MAITMLSSLPFQAVLAPLPLLLVFVALLCVSISVKTKSSTRKYANLPPGSFGLPLLGETLDFLKAGRDGQPERFVQERMNKYDSRVFKTSLLGAPMAVFCGPSGNKFLYSNENKLVNPWWPSTVRRLFGSSVITTVGDEATRMRRMLMTFLNTEALVRYIMTMDVVTQQHISTHWEGKEQVTIYPTIKLYTFELACRLFMSIEDPQHIKKLANLFNILLKGVIELPLNFPGTIFYKAMKAGKEIRKELLLIAKQKKVALEKMTISPSQDLMSHLLVTSDENDKFLTEEEIVNSILILLFAGYDTSSSVITLLMKYLADLPAEVYDKVLTEQMEIASSKGAGELLKWEDIQQMRHSWNVVSEVMRIWPPASGGFRVAIEDFTYAGYTIPKGWKLYWSASSTHQDSNVFPSNEEFDASRFEGDGPTPYSYIPFGGGPRMCLGKGFARLEILVFLHNVVKRFKWDLLIPNEKIGYDPLPTPAEGLPVRLIPHKSAA